MENENKTGNRKKFILWGAGILSFFALGKFASKKTEKKKETVKMLTQDGKLVEVDKQLLASGSKKISNEELQQWISKK